MSTWLNDINTIDKDTEKKWKKIIKQRLVDVQDDGGDLKLIFEKVEVIISCQESDAYGIGVFHDFRKRTINGIKEEKNDRY